MITRKEYEKVCARINRIEAWIDAWEGIGEEAYDSGWVKYRKQSKKKKKCAR